ncbi:MAG: hypothetical protein D6715_10510 [Calditrichaeota bacterium]|nr:MAG: hypothetical protein D6715_10510 [Calditrichota bacterium]
MANRYKLRLFSLGFIVALAFSGKAQQSEPAFEAFKQQFQKEYFSIGVLFQGVADFQPERSMAGRNGFSIANARLRVYGKMDAGFGYLVQSSFVSNPVLLDGKMYLEVSPQLAVDFGLFKAPFSGELLTSAAALDFVNRSQVVSALAPGRQIGFQFRGRAAQDRLHYFAGMFNGNGRTFSGNDNNHFLYAARAAFYPLKQDGVSRQAPHVEVGLNGAVSKDDRAAIPFPGLDGPFSGNRYLYGLDLRAERYPYLLSGEILAASLDGRSGARMVDINPWGFHLTGGYYAMPDLQLLVRWDSLHPDEVAPTVNLLILGLNYWPSQIAEFQLNWVADTDNNLVKNGQWLVNAQIYF